MHYLENNDYFVLLRVSAKNSTALKWFNSKVILKSFYES